MTNILLPCVLALSSLVQAEPRHQLWLRSVDATETRLESAKIQPDWKVSGRGTDGKPVAASGADLLEFRFATVHPTHRPRGSQIVLAGGGVIRGDVLACDSEFALVVNEILGELEIPLTAIRAILLDRDALPVQADRLERRLRFSDDDPPGDLLLLRNGDRLVGLFDGLGDGVVRLDRGGEVLTLERELVRGIAFDPALIDARPIQGLHALVTLADASRFPVRRCVGDATPGAIATTLQLDAPVVAEPLRVPPVEMISLSFRNGRAVYLSDIEPTLTETVPYLDGSFVPQADRNVLGAPLRVSGLTFAKGLGTRSRTLLRYDLAALPGQWQRFAATLALDDSAGDLASVRFVVRLDGAPAYDGGEFTPGSPPVELSLPLEGKQTLELVVDYGRRADVGDHANWCDARLIRTAD